VEKTILNKNIIGKEYPSITYNVSKRRLIEFAKATEEVNPIYYDERIAKENGYPTIIAPPTFLTVIAMQQENPYEYLDKINVRLSSVLHAGQQYSYHHPVYAGDEIRMKNKIEDIYFKKNNSIAFIDFYSKYINQNNIKVAESISTLAIR
tara:strand:- start:1307 stop:1756 length:450 start_codon:yes stop_codon:yes gene_type:complete